MDTGIKRYKNHQILIKRQFDKYYYDLKCIELSENNSEIQDSYSSSDELSKGLNESIDSIVLNQDFNEATNQDGDLVDDLKDLENLKRELLSDQTVDEAQKQFISRKKTFDSKFENTLLNFTINIDFLNR